MQTSGCLCLFVFGLHCQGRSVVFPFRYAQEGVVKQAPKAQASRVVWGVLPQKSFILGASEMTRKFGYYFVNIHIRVLVYPEYCQRGQPLLNRLSHKALGKFSATFKLIWFIGYCVSVWTPGLVQLPMRAYCCTPAQEVSGITWHVFKMADITVSD